MSAVNTTSGNGSDYSKQIYDALPTTAKQYYVERTDKTLSELCHQVTYSEGVWRTANLLRLYPFTNLMYLNSNEFVCAIVNGHHRIYQGPGFQWVVGITDCMGTKITVGNDIDFGPIKLIYVRPGTLKFAKYRNTGRPLLLGPGMHYFNDLNLEIGNEINMNFHGDNQLIKCDDGGAFTFVFVRTGSEAILISRDGTLSTLPPGLHFIQSPDALKNFVSTQQEHFRFGSSDKNQCFLTADNIELHINATIFYRIVDVRTMFTTRIKDESDLMETLHSQAMATLLTIIRSENFQGIGNRSQVSTIKNDLSKGFQFGSPDEAANAASVASAPLAQVAQAIPNNNNNGGAKHDDTQERLMMGFQNIIHDAEPQFQRIMNTNFGSNGIEIQALRIEQIEFADKDMQRQVSEFAMTNTKLTSQQQTINAQRAIRVAEAERDAASMMINSRAEADKKTLLMEAENRIKINTAKAEAEKVLIAADAEAQAKLRVGEAELSLMERQNQMPNAQLRIFTEAQKEVMKGVTKVIYTDQQSLLMKPFYNLPDVNSSK